MELRKLSPKEHQKTRKLWEKIFIEDTKEFLDYYYAVKTEKNEIFVMEDADEIIAMLHLNPYELTVNQKVYPANYIVAVATDDRYRKRGIMASLLKQSMQVMYQRKEPFTFLMPAAEAIYYPHDFRFVYRQKQSEVVGKQAKTDELELMHATAEDCAEIAAFANRFLKTYQVVAKRDEAYYKTLIAEWESESGGVVMVRQNGNLTGVFCYAKGERYEIWEPLFLHASDLEQAVYILTKSEEEPVKCIAYGNEKEVPMIMARILHLETFLKCCSLKEDVDFCVRVKDRLLEENDGVFHIKGKKEEGIVRVEKIEQPFDVCCEIGIGEWTSILFGYQAAADSELSKIEPLQKVFLNEIV